MIRKSSRSFSHTRRRARAYSVAMESLEPRTLLSGITFFSRTWTINGDADKAHPNDTITIAYSLQSKKLELTINGVLKDSRAPANVRGIVINGGKGDDVITVNTESLAFKTNPVTIKGGDGNDTITCGREVDTVDGGNGDDTISGGEGNDNLSGGNGNDTLNGDDGNDVLTGGAGDDILNGGNGNDKLIGGNGNDNLNGNDGEDSLSGGNGNDTLQGNDGNDNLSGGAGDDIVNGGDGGDVLDGGDGSDILDGGAEADTLLGGKGGDTLIGGDGSDSLTGGKGYDTLYCVTGQDQHGDLTSDLGFLFGPNDHVINLSQPVLVDNPPPVGAEGDVHSVPVASYTGPLRQKLIDQAVDSYHALLGYTFIHDTPPVLNHSGGVLILNTPPSPVLPITPFQSNPLIPMKIDGNLVFTLKSNRLTITDVTDPANAQIVSSIITDPGTPAQFYHVGDRLVVLTTQKAFFPTHLPLPSQFVLPVDTTGTFQYVTAVATYDIADPAHPQLVEHSSYTGSLASSSVVGDQLYLVLGNSINLPAPLALPTGTLTAPDYNGHIFAEYRYQTEAEYRQWLGDHLNEYLPAFTTTLANGSDGPSGSLLNNIQFTSYGPDVVTFNVFNSFGRVSTSFPVFTTLVDIDVADATTGPADVVSAEGSTPQLVTATDQDLYAFTLAPLRKYSGTSILNAGLTISFQYPQILKFDLGLHSVQFDAAGHVDGVLPDSNSMDEFNGQLRVVTYPNNRSALLSVLTDTGGQLVVTGSTVIQTPGETDNKPPATSVLWDGDRAFLSIFILTNYGNSSILHTIDLANPVHPVETGNSQLDAFPTSIVPIDGNHVLLPERLSLVDVSDKTNPTLIDHQVVPAPNTVALNILTPALSYSPGSGILALPFNVFNYAALTDHNSQVFFYQVQPATGFTLIGSTPTTGNLLDTLSLGAYCYILTSDSLYIVDPLNPATPIAHISL